MDIQEKLTKIWKEQKAFQTHFFDPDNLPEEDKIKFTKEFILSMHRELGEVLNEIPWKLHRANSKDYNPEHIREELIDCFKFLLNVCIIWGMDEESFFDTFMKKTAIVQKRWEDEHTQ